jgi:hypothetical protein
MYKIVDYKIQLKTELNFEKATELIKIIYKEKMNLIIKNSTEEERNKIIRREGIEDMKKLSDISSNELTLEQQNKIIKEIKEYAKDLAIQKNLDSKVVDLTTISKDLGLNPTRVKNGLEKGADKAFKFNYIDRKNLDVNVTSSFVAGVETKYDKKEKTTWLSYQIPKPILKLLLIPSIYIPIEEVMVKKVEGNYTLRMHGLLKDHLLKGEVEVTKEELFNFFLLPASYSNKNNLKTKFLEPTLKEVEKVSGIETQYKFVPERNYKKIIFKPKLRNKVVADKINVISKEEAEKKKMDSSIQLEHGPLAESVNKAKRNIYVSKSWNKRMDNKVKKICKEHNEKYAIFILNELYKSLKEEIKTTLVQYVNGMLKNIEYEPYNEENIEPVVELEIIEKNQDTLKAKKNEETILETIEIDVIKSNKKLTLDSFEAMEEMERTLLEGKALKLCSDREQIDIRFLFNLKEKSKAIYFNTMKKYIIEIIEKK